MDIIDWLKKRGITVTKKDLIHQAFMHSSYAHEHRQYQHILILSQILRALKIPVQQTLGVQRNYHLTLMF